MFMHEIGAF
jgi:prevent-host-death family protein